MYSPVIAEVLRERGHDAISVYDAGSAGAADSQVLAFASAHGRTLFTENVRDFAPLLLTVAASGDLDTGTIFSSPRSFPRRASTIGVFADALAALCTAHPDDDSLFGQVVWLQPGE